MAKPKNNKTKTKLQTPGDKAIRKTFKEVDKGRFKTAEEAREYYDRALHNEMAKLLTEIETITKKAERSQTTGLIVGSLMTLIGGVFAGSLFWWMTNKNDASTILAVFSGVMFFLGLLMIVFRKN